MDTEFLRGLLTCHVQFADLDYARPVCGFMESCRCFIASGHGPYCQNHRGYVQSEKVTDGFISYSPFRSSDNDCLPAQVVSGDW